MDTFAKPRLTMAGLVLAALAMPGLLEAQAAQGGASPRAVEARARTLSARDEAELAQELARMHAERRQLEARIATLAIMLDTSAHLDARSRSRLQAELEDQMRRLTESHARVGLDVGSRIVLGRGSSVASTEVRRTLIDAQQRLSSAARMGYVGITLSPTDNHVRAQGQGELYVRYFEHPSIISIEPGSPAEQAGLRRGDVLIAFNSADVRRELPMHELLQPGNRVTVRVRRDGRDRSVALTVADPPAIVRGRRTDFLASPGELRGRVYAPSVGASAAAGGGTIRGATAPLPVTPSFDREVTIAAVPAAAPRTTYRFEVARGVAGAELAVIAGGLADALGVKQGLLVMRVAPQSPAATSGLRDGDVILKANGSAVNDIAALSRAMRENEAARALSLETLRARKKRMVRLTW